MERSRHMPALILASSSPRRRELLATLGVRFGIAPSGIEEEFPPGVGVEQGVVTLAQAKADLVAESYPRALVLAADTLVVFQGEWLGKPADAEAARATLRRLRGRRHSVLTGVCARSDSAGRQAVVSTEVTMRDYSDAEIDASIAAGAPFDKAGGYGIQDALLAPVERIDGCYCNVMGLPLWTVRAMLSAVAPRFAPLRPDAARPACALCPLRPLAEQRDASHSAGAGPGRQGLGR